jgi:hypothetical protein
MEIIILITLCSLVIIWYFLTINKKETKPKYITRDVVKMTEKAEETNQFYPTVIQDAYYKDELYHLTTWLKLKKHDLPQEVLEQVGYKFTGYTQTPYENTIIGNAEFIKQHKQSEYEKAMEYLNVEIPIIESQKLEIENNLRDFNKKYKI